MIDAFEPRRCAVCGCTDRHACVTGRVACHWVAWDLCSACEDRAAQDEDAQARGNLLLAAAAAFVAALALVVTLAAWAQLAARIPQS